MGAHLQDCRHLFPGVGTGLSVDEADRLARSAYASPLFFEEEPRRETKPGGEPAWLFPPCLIQVGAAELLLSDSERFARKLRRLGCSVQLEVWPRMWHCFHMYHPRSSIFWIVRF
eukprot:COSAG05_NODE_1760_length_4133_cov_5.514130_3_plen_115_part_00